MKQEKFDRAKILDKEIKELNYAIKNLKQSDEFPISVFQNGNVLVSVSSDDIHWFLTHKLEEKELEFNYL